MYTNTVTPRKKKKDDGIITISVVFDMFTLFDCYTCTNRYMGYLSPSELNWI
jgi:hypothetical protein